MDGQQIIGIVLFNVFGSGIDIARRIISDGREHEDLKEVFTISTISSFSFIYSLCLLIFPHYSKIFPTILYPVVYFLCRFYGTFDQRSRDRWSGNFLVGFFRIIFAVFALSLSEIFYFLWRDILIVVLELWYRCSSEEICWEVLIMGIGWTKWIVKIYLMWSLSSRWRSCSSCIATKTTTTRKAPIIKISWECM